MRYWSKARSGALVTPSGPHSAVHGAQDLRAARARRDVFLQMNSDLVEPFSSRFAFGRILRQASGRKVLPLDIGSRWVRLRVSGEAPQEAPIWRRRVGGFPRGRPCSRASTPTQTSGRQNLDGARQHTM